MRAEPLLWSHDDADPLLQHFCFVDSAADTLVGGTGHFKAGQVMPSAGFSQYPMREISFILEGSIRTESGGKTVVLHAGDMVSIPPNQKQISHFLEDTKLVYFFFGNRVVSNSEDDASLFDD